MDSASFISSQPEKEGKNIVNLCIHALGSLSWGKVLVLFRLMNIGAEPTGAGCTTAETSGGIDLALAVPSHPTDPGHSGREGASLSHGI